MIATDRTRRALRRYGRLKIWGATAGARQAWRPTPLPTYYLTADTPDELRRQTAAALLDVTVRSGLTVPVGVRHG